MTAAVVYEWTSLHVRDDADAGFIGGNGFRAVGAIAALERALGRPVLTSNQDAHADATFEVIGYCRLFGHPPPVADLGDRHGLAAGR
jgi:maleate isomerase